MEAPQDIDERRFVKYAQLCTAAEAAIRTLRRAEIHHAPGTPRQWRKLRHLIPEDLITLFGAAKVQEMLISAHVPRVGLYKYELHFDTEIGRSAMHMMVMMTRREIAVVRRETPQTVPITQTPLATDRHAQRKRTFSGAFGGEKVNYDATNDASTLICTESLAPALLRDTDFIPRCVAVSNDITKHSAAALNLLFLHYGIEQPQPSAIQSFERECCIDVSLKDLSDVIDKGVGC
jgi:hypothetical protein